MTGWRPAVSAHRGGTDAQRGGTHEAYRGAVASGAEYIELDIRKLGDGALVCYHHAKADHSGARVSTLTYRELCATVGYEVPTVSAVMTLLVGQAMGHLDLKESGHEDEVIRLATDVLGPDGYVVTTPQDSSIRRISRGYPWVRTALSLGQDWPEIPLARRPAARCGELFPVRRVRECGASWVAVNKTLARWGVLRQCSAQGIGAMVWTVDGDAEIDRFLGDSRVDVLITNRPRYAITRRATLAGQDIS